MEQPLRDSYNNPTTPPEEGKVVKLLVSCPKKGEDWNQTTTGYWASGRYFMDQFQGSCYKVIGWAPLESNTENYGTERI